MNVAMQDGRAAILASVKGTRHSSSDAGGWVRSGSTRSALTWRLGRSEGSIPAV